MAEAVERTDELVREYLLFRGFTHTLRQLDAEIKADKEKGFRVRGLAGVARAEATRGSPGTAPRPHRPQGPELRCHRRRGGLGAPGRSLTDEELRPWDGLTCPKLSCEPGALPWCPDSCLVHPAWPPSRCC